MESLVEEEVRLDGAQVTATLRYSGVLQWRRRNDLRLSFANDASQQLWFENIQMFLTEAGNSRSWSLSLSLCLSLFCNMMRNGRRGSRNRFEPSYL